MQDGIRIACTTTEHVSLAYHQNAIPIVREIIVENASPSDLATVRLTLSSHPPVIRPFTIHIERIATGQTHHVAAADIQLDSTLLAGFTEASALDLTLKLEDDAGNRQDIAVPLRLLPPSHWGGGQSAPELLAAFVRPNDPAVDVVLRDAATKLAAAGRETALNGYASGRKSRAWEMAEAVWAGGRPSPQTPGAVWRLGSKKRAAMLTSTPTATKAGAKFITFANAPKASGPNAIPT